jgi:predicted acylesterase/phospholipase RssA
MATYPPNPALECDLIMKGGITSGVIYPGAVCRLAQVYRLRSIGGASAGAIAAAAAAAAEYGRAGGGFDRLEQLPRDLTAPVTSGESMLFSLFQPQPPTAGLFKVMTAGLGRSGVDRARRIAVATLTAHPLWALLGALPGLLILALAWAAAGASPGVAVWVGVVGALVLLLGLAIGSAIGLLHRLASAVPANGFGLCSGMDGSPPSRTMSLTPWLHRKLQELAGRDDGAPPLTFGDLERAGVDLRMMTTNLTRRQPLALPWSTREYYFDPQAWRRLFPTDVVNWLESHPPQPTGGPVAVADTELLRAQALPLRPLPEPADLPVVVATRMSLSFPLLISAVPLHAVDYYSSNASRDARAAAQRWRREHPDGTVAQALDELPRPAFGLNWFSDGGICSNLPVHFFDRPLPTRPTFAVDLAPFPPGTSKSTHEADNSYLPGVNQGGIQRRWTVWAPAGLNALVGFGLSIVDTARSWVDEGQIVMPGYRDRIVTIWHDDEEGGMNLAMPKDTVSALAARGDGAAAKLVERFAEPGQTGDSPAGWDNHRWIRFRTATAGLEDWLGAFRSGYDAPDGPAVQYRELAGPTADAPLPSYGLTGARRSVVNARTRELLGLAQRWNQQPVDAFSRGAPAPRPMLRLVPGGDLTRTSMRQSDLPIPLEAPVSEVVEPAQ